MVKQALKFGIPDIIVSAKRQSCSGISVRFFIFFSFFFFGLLRARIMSASKVGLVGCVPNHKQVRQGRQWGSRGRQLVRSLFSDSFFSPACVWTRLLTSIASWFRADLTRACCDARCYGCIETTGARSRAHPRRASVPSCCRVCRAVGNDIPENAKSKA